MGLLVNSTKNSKEEIIPILYSLFQNTEAEGILSNLFYEARIILIPKQDKDITRKEDSDEYLSETDSQQNISKLNLTMYKKIIHHDQLGFIPGIQADSAFKKSINVIHHINRLKKENHMIPSINSYRVNGEKLKSFPANIRKKAKLSLPPLLFHTVLEVLKNTVRKGNKTYADWEGRNKTVFVHRQYDHLCRKSKRTGQKKKLLKLISNYRKAARYKVNI